MMKYRGLSPLAAFLLMSVSVVVTGCDDHSGKSGQRPAAQVDVITLKSSPLALTNELLGRTAAWRVAEVRPQVSGIILKRNFTEGSDVAAGVSLYQIDPSTYQAAYDSAKGELARAQANARIAQLTLDRYKPLLGTQYISKQDYDTAAATLAQNNAAVTTAKASLESARINLNYTKVMSPIAGRIGKSAVTEGALVQNGQTSALATVQQIDPMYVDLTQSSDEYLKLRAELSSGQVTQNGKAEVQIVLDNGQTFVHKGTLEFSDVTVDETTGSITLRAIVPNPEHTLLPGMFVRAKISEGTKQNAILVPQQGISRTPTGQASALIVNKDNKVEVRQVTTGMAVGNKWLITSGLQQGDRVIISGLQKTAPGAEVKPQEVNPQDQQNQDAPTGAAH